MSWTLAAIAAAIILGVLLDAFEVMVLPRRITHPYRLARLFYRLMWRGWRTLAVRIPAGRWRNGFLGIFGPISLLALVAVWAVGLIVGFAVLHWSLDLRTSTGDGSVLTYVYFSGTTFFTLGYGDMVPTGTSGRALSVIEAGIGFAFLATVVSYLPVLYQAFSRREITISLLDARASSPPTSSELLRRLASGQSMASAGPLLREWERWSAELLESHLSFPVLSFYRSQHDNQSWVAALTTMLDTSALLIVSGGHSYQARLTFAMARHAAVDLGLVFQSRPCPLGTDRLDDTTFARLRETLRAAGLELGAGPEVRTALDELRGLYEPFVNALANYFMLNMPPFLPEKPPVDNWQTSAYMRRSPGLGSLSAIPTHDEHFN